MEPHTTEVEVGDLVIDDVQESLDPGVHHLVGAGVTVLVHGVVEEGSRHTAGPWPRRYVGSVGGD